MYLWLIDRLIVDWLIAWFVDWLVGRSLDRLIAWFLGPMGWLFDGLIDRSDRLAGRLVYHTFDEIGCYHDERLQL